MFGSRRSGPAVAAAILVLASGQLAGQAAPTAPRLRAGAAVPLPPPMAVGGGEVALDVTVDASGAVTQVAPLRATPPYTDLLMGAVRAWRFDAATAVTKNGSKPAEGHVLLVAVYRPPQVYAGPTLGPTPETVGTASPELPQPGALGMPASYPPRAVRDGAVLIEIELTAAAIARAHRVMSPASPFDGAALEAVKTWRFGFPGKPTGAAQLYAYAIVGFREPVTR
jgi:hypothetical protein